LRLHKLVVFIPNGYEDEVRQAICGAGAGRLPACGSGNYDECTFQMGGTGTFRPLPGANPFLGRVGELERAEESRLETVVPDTRLDEVIRAMLAAHPYEEVAYDLYPVDNRTPCRVGLGRVGQLPNPKPLRDFAEQVGVALGLRTLRLVGDPERMISRVALCGGSAMSLLKWAQEAGADVYITGDVRHHDALSALGRGIAVIDAGHHATEKVIVPAMAAYLTEKAVAAGETLAVVVSQVNTDPFSLLETDFRGQKPVVDGCTPEYQQTSLRAARAGLAKAGVQPANTPIKKEPLADMKGSADTGGVHGQDQADQALAVRGKLIIYIDGASRGNPGNASAGVVILDEQQMPVLERKKYLGKTTNNVAEYQALILALQEVSSMGGIQVEIRTDSELLARQWNGEYRVQNSGLIPLMQQARSLARQLQSCTVTHVPRERNKRADELANQAIDEYIKRSDA
jgi:ribonuclease HI